MNGFVRAVEPGDVPALRHVVDSTGLFPGEWMDGMVAGFLEDRENGQVWLVWEDAERVQGLLYCGPEPMADGTFNMYLLAVESGVQGKGIGGRLTAHLEGLLRERGARVLLVETSGLPEFEATRAFYRAQGYVRVAVVPEFYAAGEDKVVFWKAL